MVLVFLISVGSVFLNFRDRGATLRLGGGNRATPAPPPPPTPRSLNLGADKEKAGSAVLLSALEIVFGTDKDILSRERRPGREGIRRRISSDRYVGALS